jgi:hypothetical protein
MIAAELAQRCLVEVKQNLAQLLGFRITGCEALSVNLTQRADEGVAVLLADFAISVAVAPSTVPKVARTRPSILPARPNGN